MTGLKKPIVNLPYKKAANGWFLSTDNKQAMSVDTYSDSIV